VAVQFRLFAVRDVVVRQGARTFIKTFVLFLVVTTAPRAFAADSKMVTYSLQVLALAPNAGGQNAYALRRATDSSEYALFYNNYLGAGNFPLIGAIARRFVLTRCRRLSVIFARFKLRNSRVKRL
jgi:hypothetical protein